MSFVRQIMNKPGTEPRPERAPEPPRPRPSPPREAAAPEEAPEDGDFGEEFGHSARKGRGAGGEGFERDEYDKVV